MKRDDLIRKVKDANEKFFNRESRRFFGDRKYSWRTKEQTLVITMSKDRMTREVYYVWDNSTFRLHLL